MNGRWDRIAGRHVVKDDFDDAIGDHDIMFGYEDYKTVNAMSLTHSMETRLKES